MQFKHPEVLWALLLLLIPIIIHLFQLRRFKKTPFTNVAMLQKVVAESRKGNRLKKWLLLLSRLGLLAALAIAFAQPFHAKSGALGKKETVIYLDNSFSMQAYRNGFTLLEKSVQDLLQSLPTTSGFSIITNTRTFRNVTLSEIQNELLTLTPVLEQLTFEQIVLKANSVFSNDDNSQKHLILISDFQQRLFSGNTIPFENLHFVRQLPTEQNNIAIDSVYLSSSTEDQTPLHILISGLEKDQTVPISLFDGEKLIAKTAVKGNGLAQSESVLSLQRNQPIQGYLEIEDAVLDFDNHFFFNIDERAKPKILAISETGFNFLERIFTDSDFEFLNVALKDLNYSLVETQNTILLNGLPVIPSGLSTVLKSFQQAGGSLVVIPPSRSFDLNSYNALFDGMLPLRFLEMVPIAQNITTIAFQHPLYTNVFQKEVSNFDYPQVSNFIKVRSTAAHALSFASGEAFLVGQDNVFVFTASLDKENSNFVNSPLVIPTFYNIGDYSLKNPDLYLTIGNGVNVDVPNPLRNDNILKLTKSDYEFIPLQQSFSNKISLNFEEAPYSAGIYSVLDNRDTLRHLSFNFPRKESKLIYGQPENLNPKTMNEDIVALFQKLKADSSILQYWKWFVILALIFAMLELLIQKLLP